MATEKLSVQLKHVCVIGASPSGLVAARELRKEGHGLVVLEQNHDIGGQWLYEPNVEGEDPLGRDPILNVHSSVYESLRLLSPREIMGFSDFPFLVKKDRDTRRFPGHREFLLYLQDFAEWFGLRELIRFNTRVEHAATADSGEFRKDLRWVVKSKEITTKGGDDTDEKMVEEVFDAVVVATGHYSHPRLPSIKGVATWKRKQFQSCLQSVPEPFRDEVVVVVGNSHSGQDISMELAVGAREVHLSSKSLDMTEGSSKVLDKPRNLCLRPQIDSLKEDGTVSFVDDSSVITDTILYCTGYSYTFPFLDTKGIVAVEDDRVGPLYEHTFPPFLAPSLSFVGIPKKIIGFPFFESQAKWIAQLLSGKRTLPPGNAMMQSIEDFYSSIDAAGLPKRDTHVIANFEYCEKYEDNAEFPHLEEWRKELFLWNVKSLAANLETFRDSWDEGNEKVLQEAFQSPHFTQLGSHKY